MPTTAPTHTTPPAAAEGSGPAPHPGPAVRRWAVPLGSGGLIVAGLVLGRVEPGWQAAAWLLATVVAGAPILRAALRGLAVRTVGIDLLVSIAAIGAIAIGEHWEAAAVTFLFAVGHALESATLDRTRAALAELVAVAPEVAVVLRDGEQVEVRPRDVHPGEVVLVKAGARVPVDGRVLLGHGTVDESSVTGEPLPAEKSVATEVYAGTVAVSGLLQVIATGVGPDTTLARIIRRVEEAQDARARTQAFMERFSAWYTPAIVVLAVVGGLVTGDLVLALTLLVIGCPGALVISIPVAVVAGVGRAARDGILVRGGEHLETAARIDTVALDKTGTLTRGEPVLTDVVVLDPALDQRALLSWAARAEAGTEHPLAGPILAAARAVGVPPVGVADDTEAVPGQGVAATVEGRRVLVGNARLLRGRGVTDLGPALAESDRLAAAGRIPVLVALDDAPVGVLAVADELRPGAAEMVAALHRAGIDRVLMLTGDNRRVAEAVAAATGIDEVHAELLPEDKLALITELTAAGRTVAMVGDGVNDAPALATAAVGVAMGAAGSAVAVETADIALMTDDLARLPEAITLARRTVRAMRQNIVIALGTVALLLAGVLVGGVTMAAGMLVHEASVLVVIGNAMRLLRRRHRPTHPAPGAHPDHGTDPGSLPRPGAHALDHAA